MKEERFISLCLITKNEDYCLARCLESAKKLVDEIIIVDTGSEDNTISTARIYGASVFPFAWIDDFSAARNFAISKASGTWILFLDADEVLAPLSRDELTAFLKTSQAEGYYFKICSYLDHTYETVEDYVVRLFKNKPEYRFIGAIHEQIAGSIKSSCGDTSLFLSPFTIYHYGYLSEVLELKCKFKRNTSVLQKALKEKPEDPFLHYCLGVEFLQNRDFQKADRLLVRTITLMRGNEGYLPQVLVALLLVKLTKPDGQNCEELFRRAIRALPNNGDIYCLYGIWLMQHTQYIEAAEVIENALLNETELLKPGRIKSFAGDLNYLAGKSDQAAEYYKAALLENDNDLYSLVRMLNLWSKGFGLKCRNELLGKLTPEYTNNLLNLAIQSGMYEVSLIVILCEILYSIWANDIERVVAQCDVYWRKLVSSSFKNIRSEIYNILLKGGEELKLHGCLLNLSCGRLNTMQQEFSDCALINLMILSSLIEDISPADQLKIWEGAFIGETHFACQPD